MARATDGATGSAIGKPSRSAAGGDRPASRPARPAQVRRMPPYWNTAVQFLQEVRAELNRVAWPDRQTVIASSVVVVFVLIVTALYLSGWDLLFAKIFEQILKP